MEPAVGSEGSARENIQDWGQSYCGEIELELVIRADYEGSDLESKVSAF